MHRVLLPVLILASSALAQLRAAELDLQPVEVVETKAVFGRVETRDVVAARARIGGTLVSVDVTEGDAVKQGDRIALVADDKLALQLNAAEARIRALNTEQANARTEYDRARDLLARGAGTQQRVDLTRTAYEVFRNQIAAAEADKAVITQQAAEGAVVAPATGRVLTRAATRGAVILPGEPVATIAGGGFFLRLALPERFAATLKTGSTIRVDGRAGAAATTGKLVKIFPQLENGKVIADVEVDTLGDYFVGERVLALVPVATRKVLAVPPAALSNRAGVDFIAVVTPSGRRDVAVITGGPVSTPQGERIEILTGLRPGDRVIVP